MLTGYEVLDQPGPPKPNSSAMKIDQDQREAARENRRRRTRETIEAAGKLEDDRDAYDRVMEARRTRRPSSPADQRMAERYALAQGLVKPKSSVQRLIEQGQRQRQRRAS